MSQTVEAFIARWLVSGGAERANKDAFLFELCDILEVPRPNPTTGIAGKDDYVYEKDAITPHEGGVATVGKIDLYKAGAFILEAKQGSAAGARKLGTAKRETPAWHLAMQDARGQAAGYARTFDTPVPFLVTCDIGYCFDLYACFDGSRQYRDFPSAQLSRIFFKDLTDPKHRDTLRRVFLDPLSLDPSKQAAKVTREVATHLANLAKVLEIDGHSQELVATFLMRCIFTMFAEDVGLLPEGAFTKALRDHWIPSPRSFVGGVESLWRAMNEGGELYTVGKVLRFNGGLFQSPTALPLDEHALRLLCVAAECNWAEVEPAIFGTLVERALDPKERHRLGAHYTPRAYVERLVRPTVEEPLRADWDVVRAQARQLMQEAESAKTPTGRKAKLKEALGITHDFQTKLCATQVLDPACGSGNFLYVTLDVLKRLEGEVIALLESLGEKQTLLHMETIRVTPGQFHGIEVKRWAKEIAELVLWIGYLQWHFRTYGKDRPVPEPVLRDYKNIECRDAVLAWDGEPELVRDAKGKPVTRWDGETMKRSPVTGEEVPDERATVPVYRYVNPRKAEWPKVDFIVGNPPFMGTKRMKAALGDGYVEALRMTYAPEVEDNADFVMFWWDKAASLLEEKKIRSFGLITTNSVTQNFNRRVLRRHLLAGLRLVWAIPDHPWSDSETGAAVRIAMTCATMDRARPALLLKVMREVPDPGAGDGAQHIDFECTRGSVIHEDLRIGAGIAGTVRLRANHGISGMGVALHGRGFVLAPDVARRLRRGAGDKTIRLYLGGRDLLQAPRQRYLIDFSFMSEEEARQANPAAFQHVTDHVLPGRRLNRRDSIRNLWWRFGWERPLVRRALQGLSRFVATTETAKHRVFQFVPGEVLPDHMIVVIASEDAAHFGVLSSRVHQLWAKEAGGTLEDRPRYNKSVCFDPFPFPSPSVAQTRRIRVLAEALDAHRKRQQAAHPKLTMTAMYNVIEKLRAEEWLDDEERVIHEQGLTSVLRKLHDDLDAAVFEAYGWPADLTDEQILERLVALNAERAEEEKRGLVRWLRPDFQAPQGAPMTQVALTDAEEDDKPEAPTAVGGAPWPRKLPDQIGAIRDLVRAPGSTWSVEEVAGSFKGAKRKEVEAVLESLAALGLLLAYKTAKGRRWKTPRLGG